MRIESSVTSVSWIPSEAVTGAFKVPFSMGMAHYDDPPPDRLEDPAALAAADRCRFCNQLAAFIELEDGRISRYGFIGDGVVGSTTLRLGPASLTIAPFVFPTLRPEPVLNTTEVTFRQTCGARTGVPAPRPVKRPPYFQISAPTAWTTLELTIGIDGTSRGRLIGASPFPRHWVYDRTLNLVEKTSVVDFSAWSDLHFGDNTPWGDADSPALISAVESALERQLSTTIMRGGHKPELRVLQPGEVLCAQGDTGDELYLLLDGVLEVLVDGNKLAEFGPGAVLGERAMLDGGTRTSTLRSVTRCRVASAAASSIDREHLEDLATRHRRESE